MSSTRRKMAHGRVRLHRDGWPLVQHSVCGCMRRGTRFPKRTSRPHRGIKGSARAAAPGVVVAAQEAWSRHARTVRPRKGKGEDACTRTRVSTVPGRATMGRATRRAMLRQSTTCLLRTCVCAPRQFWRAQTSCCVAQRSTSLACATFVTMRKKMHGSVRQSTI